MSFQYEEIWPYREKIVQEIFAFVSWNVLCLSSPLLSADINPSDLHEFQ